MATFVFRDVSWDLIWSHGTILLFALFQSLMLSLVGHCKHAQWRMFEFEPGVKIFYWASKDIRKCHQALQCINVSKPIQWMTLFCKRVKKTQYCIVQYSIRYDEVCTILQCRERLRVALKTFENCCRRLFEGSQVSLQFPASCIWPASTPTGTKPTQPNQPNPDWYITNQIYPTPISHLLLKAP